MSRSRSVVMASFLVVGVGIVAAVGALYLDPARAAVGPLPAEGLALPASTQFLMGLDVPRFVSSPFYKRQAAAIAAARPKAFAELEEKTGINPERDLELVLVAGNGRDSGVILVRGRFDQYKVSRLIETSKPGVTSKKFEGVSMYLSDEGKRHAQAVAFLADDVLVLGSQPAVEATIASHAKGVGGLKGNAALLALVETVKPGSTFWMVGDQTLLSQMPKSLPQMGSGGEGQAPVGASLGLPALKSLVATGDLDPELSFDLTAEAGSEADARNLADVVRGLVAMAALQSSQKPELKGLTSAISVTTDAHRVRLSAHLPYEVLDALQPKAAPRARPSGQ